MSIHSQPVFQSSRWQQASELHQAGRAAAVENDQGKAIRLLRDALAVLDAPLEPQDANVNESAEQPLRARILLILAYAEAESGHPSRGLRLIDQAQQLMPPTEHADIYGQRALVLKRAGRVEEALIEYDKAFATLAEFELPGARVRALLNRSALFISSGRLDQARADLDACYALARRADDELILAKAENNLGLLEHVAGQIPDALAHFSRAESFYEAAGPGMMPLLRLDRARTLLAAGLLVEADNELARCVTELSDQQASQDTAEALYARAQAALLKHHANPLSQAAGPAGEYAKLSADTFRSRENLLWAARADLLALRAEFAIKDSAATPISNWRQLAGRLNDSAANLRDLGLDEDARVAAMTAIRCQLRTGDLPRTDTLVAQVDDRIDTRLLARLTSAEIAYSVAKPVLASRRLRAGLGDLNRVRALLGAYDLQTGTAALGRELARTGLGNALKSGIPAAIFQWSELSRAQALLTHRPQQAPDEPTRELVQQLRATELELHQASLEGRDDPTLHRRRAQLRRQLRETSRHLAGSGDSDQVVGLGRFRSELRDQASIMFLAIADQILALVITSSRSQLTPLGPLDRMAELVARLRADLNILATHRPSTTMGEVATRSASHDAASIAELLIRPLLPAIDDRPLLIVPTGVLATLPWSSLPPLHGRPVTVAPSATAWAKATRQTPAGPLQSALLVSGPRVPNAAAEVAGLAAAMSEHDVRVTTLTGGAATPDATLAALPHTDLAHFACHGHHETDNVLFSGLELAGGMLMGYDLIDRPQPTPPWVVLSACDVGLQEIRPGDETLGLASAFLVSGTATVIASTCRIHDETARTVMSDYAKQLLVGRPPSAALASATARTPTTGLICFGAG